jgi:hypothetical protein
MSLCRRCEHEIIEKTEWRKLLLSPLYQSCSKNFTACGGVRHPTALRKIPTRYVASPNGQEPKWNADAADVPNVLVPRCSDDAAGAIGNIRQSTLHLDTV